MNEELIQIAADNKRLSTENKRLKTQLKNAQEVNRDLGERLRKDAGLFDLAERQLEHNRHRRLLWASMTTGGIGVLREFVGTAPSNVDVQEYFGAMEWARLQEFEQCLQAATETVQRIKQVYNTVEATTVDTSVQQNPLYVSLLPWEDQGLA